MHFLHRTVLINETNQDKLSAVWYNNSQCHMEGKPDPETHEKGSTCAIFFTVLTIDEILRYIGILAYGIIRHAVTIANISQEA